MALQPSINFLPEGISAQELYPKVCAMIDYIVQNFQTDLNDVQDKYSSTAPARNEVVEEIIIELGFSYIQSVMSTISNSDFNELMSFISLINLLKGSRSGLELVLNLLGFDSIIYEWWEQSPVGEVDTFNLTVIVANSNVPNLDATIDAVKVFCQYYVYPVLNTVNFQFTLALASKNVTMAGFVRAYYNGTIVQRLG